MSIFLSLIIRIWNHRNTEWLMLKENSDGQVGQGLEQPDLVQDVPAQGKGIGLDDP